MVPGPPGVVHQASMPNPQPALHIQVGGHHPTRANLQPGMVLDCLQDLWQACMGGWSDNALRALDSALAPSTWRCYRSSLKHFHDFCKHEEISFPPEHEEAVTAITNFIKSATHASQQPSSTINSLLAAITALYKPLNLFPTHDPLICHL